MRFIARTSAPLRADFSGQLYATTRLLIASDLGPTDDEMVLSRINSTYKDVRTGKIPVKSWAFDLRVNDGS